MSRPRPSRRDRGRAARWGRHFRRQRHLRRRPSWTKSTGIGGRVGSATAAGRVGGRSFARRRAGRGRRLCAGRRGADLLPAFAGLTIGPAGIAIRAWARIGGRRPGSAGGRVGGSAASRRRPPARDRGAIASTANTGQGPVPQRLQGNEQDEGDNGPRNQGRA